MFHEYGYTQRPDRKGTESVIRHLPILPIYYIVTLKDPIERGLKAIIPSKKVNSCL